MSYIQPLLLLFIVLGFLGLLRLRHCSRRGLAAAGILGLFFLSWPPIDWLLSRPLEARYPIKPFQTALAPQAIVVLISSVSPPLYERPYPLPDQETFGRCEHAAWLHTHWKPLPILACTGATNRESATMRELLHRAGVPDDMIWIEERSRSTHEQAVHASEILRQRGISRIALVVEAQSMLRAAACFRKQGVEVAPAPSDYREFDPSWKEEVLPSWKSIRRNETTLHEALGLAWYWLRGWI
jgi:uncharacterized SAM-binding protein YcdF (DUF218 family)